MLVCVCEVRLSSLRQNAVSSVVPKTGQNRPIAHFLYYISILLNTHILVSS